MIKIFYDGIFVGEVLTNQSLHVDQALELIGFDDREFCLEHNIDDLDYTFFVLRY